MSEPKVLIIDDEKGLRSMLEYGLSNRGYTVSGAGSGEEAIEMANKETFDLVVCDIMMPGIDGIETLKQIKKIQPKAEVVMATGFATLETAVTAIKQGAYDYITKPYSLDQICGIFTHALEQQRLTARVEHLEEVDRLKSEFLANTNHELRTPLNAIIGFLSLMMNGIYGEMPPKQMEVIQRVLGSSQSLLQLVTNMLDMNQISAGKMAFIPEHILMKHFVEDILKNLEPLATSKNLKLSCNVPENLAIDNDPLRLKQVLVNLLSNGIKFTEKGGVTIQVSAASDASHITLDVIDSGIGIKEEDLPSLFIQFHQLDSSRTRKFSGSGLGLCIAKKMVELMGGSVSVKSQVGQGTTFSLTIPVKVKGYEPEVKEMAVVPAASESQRKRSMLVVEDDAEHRTLYQVILEREGYDVRIATNGLEGLLMAEEYKPDVVLLDLTMPKMHGFDVAKKLRKNPELVGMKILIVTGSATAENAQEALACGADEFLAKPVEPAEIASRIARLMSTIPSAA